MTATGGTRTKGGGAWTMVAVAAVVVGLLVAGALSVNKKTDIPFDPTSTSPSGTKAMVDLIKGYGADVDVPDHFPTDADVAVLFEDVVPLDDESRVHDWVRSGHTLVVTDPRSDFAPSAESPSATAGGPATSSPVIDRGQCDIDALAQVQHVDRGVSSSFDFLFRPPPRSARCFAGDDLAFVTVVPEGEGQIVSIASGLPFTNRYLAHSDNAVLATFLLAPRPGTKVAVLREGAFGGAGGGGEGLDIMGSLSRLITVGLRLFLLELGIAVIVYAIARGRRLGRPVAEPQPVQIAGSELVSAVGNLLQQMKAPDNAAVVLRGDLRRRLADRLGVPPDAPPEVLADLVAARTGRSRAEVLAVLADQPVTSELELVTLAQQIDVVREEVLHGHAP